MRIPFGIQFGYRYNQSIETGIQFTIPLSQFKFEMEDHPYPMSSTRTVLATGTASIYQYSFKSYVKYSLPIQRTRPFVRLGFGYYGGQGEVDGTYHDEGSSVSHDGSLKFDLKSAFGVVPSVGLTPWQQEDLSMFFEICLNLLTQAPAIGTPKSEGASFISVHMGITF